MKAKESPGTTGTPATRAVTIGGGFSVTGRPVSEANEVFAGAKSVTIRNGGEEYLLEKTRNGKLMLKK